MITVNDVGYQSMVDLSLGPWRPTRQSRRNARDESVRYSVVLQPRPQQVLVVGAGSGNDVAGALRAGAQHVTAVDIDRPSSTWGAAIIGASV